MNSEKYTLVEGGILLETKLSEDIDEPYQLFLDATAVRRLKYQADREVKAEQMLKYLDESILSSIRSGSEETSDLEIYIGFERRGYEVFDMYSEIQRPTISDQQATLVATHAMRQMAHDLGTYPDAEIPGMVYASVSQLNGITLETNPVGSSSMDTDGMEYRPDSERISLYSHNFYSHEMQLICISGIIALVKAG